MTDRFPDSRHFAWEGPEFKIPMEIFIFIVSNGGIRETIPVHKEHPCYYSPVLKAAFNGNFIEGQTQTYRLEGTDPKIFTLLVQWMYKQTFKHGLPEIEEPQVRGRSAWDAHGHTPPSAELDSMYSNMVALYILAERLIIPRLQNYIMGSLVEMSQKKAWSTAWMNVAYEGAKAESPLRRFAVDMLLYLVPPSWKKEHEKDFPRELLIDCLVGATMLGTGNSMEYYHKRVKLGFYVHVTPYPANAP